VVKLIRDRFLGLGDYSGHLRARTRTATASSTPGPWRAHRRVPEPGDHCASGERAGRGVLCFDLQEVLVTPEKIIKGEFVCPSDPRFARCDTTGFGPGAGRRGIDAQAPVLVR